MDEQPQGPLPQARWSLEHAVAVLHQNGLKLKPHTLSKFEGGIEFEVYSVQDSYGQRSLIPLRPGAQNVVAAKVGS